MDAQAANMALSSGDAGKGRLPAPYEKAADFYGGASRDRSGLRALAVAAHAVAPKGDRSDEKTVENLTDGFAEYQELIGRALNKTGIPACHGRSRGGRIRLRVSTPSTRFEVRSAWPSCPPPSRPGTSGERSATSQAPSRSAVAAGTGALAALGASPVCGPTSLRWVPARIRHAHGPGELSGVERRYPFRAHQGRRPERRRLTTRGRQPLQGGDLRVQLLRAPSRLCLSVLPVLLRGTSLMGPRLPFLFPAPSGLGFYLTLVLTLRLRPDTDKTSRATTHALQALPRTSAQPTKLWLPHNQ
ncbi:hypothetical protein [Streptomyces olivaceoviridis]|uniref:Uncharacterized protein n=1 Tax=Streptomyces canarius TaxID=285453 RepID=A0ABQ3CJJ4_9ACTN|nr:hypothetical protein [Streptomyces canarius]GHA21090.1 hypothetical protein GCM10010345_27770 [Streptomyces canarius]